MHAHPLSHLWLFATPRTEALQTSLSMGFLRQEYWSGLPFPSPGDLPNPGIKPLSPVPPALWVDSLWLSHLGSLILHIYIYIYTLDYYQAVLLTSYKMPSLLNLLACMCHAYFNLFTFTFAYLPSMFWYALPSVVHPFIECLLCAKF